MDIQKIKALVVDDDSRFAELFKKNLESKNCEVTVALNTQEALSYLINEHYHVAFIDCVLKDKNGMELSARIKKILGSSVQIIMMSGIVSSKSLSSYVDLGVLDCLSKPVSESEIDINLRKTREIYLYGKQDNILIKLFKEKISQIEALRYLVTLKKAVGYELFLYLSAALSTKDSLKLRFTLNNKTMEIFLNKGSFVDYKCRDPILFAERLLSNHLIGPEEAMAMKNKTEEECIEYLVSEFILSPDQIVNFKYDLLLESLKSIHPKSEALVNFEIVQEQKDSSVILTQSEYADIVFLCLKQRFNNEIFPLFDKNLMKRHLIFNKNNNSAYLPELAPLIEELKSNLKLKALYEKHIQDKNIFCFYVLYILLKGEVFISEQEELNQNYFYERYKKLEEFITQTDNSSLFHTISGTDQNYSISLEEKKKIYNNFLKKNHPDAISNQNLSEKILNQVNQTIRAFGRLYEAETNPDVRREEQIQKKEDELNKEVLMTENKKLMERYLEEKNYKSAFSIFETVPDETVHEDLDWQLLAVWLYMKQEKRDRKTEKKLLNLMSSIQKNKNGLDKNKIYFYVVGLNYMSRNEYQKALASFKISKKLDYAFKANYEEIRKCSLKNLKTGKKANPFDKILKLKKKIG